jgi:hypothetical protein
MRITISVLFLFVKSLIYKAFSILFNDNRLCGCSETSAAEPFSIFAGKPFNERSKGVHFSAKGCAHLNYSSKIAKNKVAWQQAFWSVHLWIIEKKIIFEYRHQAVQT